MKGLKRMQSVLSLSLSPSLYFPSCKSGVKPQWVTAQDLVSGFKNGFHPLLAENRGQVIEPLQALTSPIVKLRYKNIYIVDAKCM